MSSMIKKYLALSMFVFSSQAMAADMRDAEVAMDRGNLKLAMKIWTELAEKGDLVAPVHLGYQYAKNARNGNKEDGKKAYYWYSKCAEMDACKLELAKLHDEGVGTSRDKQKAMGLYRQVIDSDLDWSDGKDEARVKAGLIYMTDKNFHDKAEAEKLFATAARHGDPQACLWMGLILQGKQPVNDNYVEAYKFLYLANSKGNYSAMGQMQNLEQKMTNAEIAQAKKLAAEWRPSK